MYNGAAHLSACLESVSSQTVADFEAVLVDDGSTDGTVEIAENYSRRDSRFRLYRNQQNLGLVRNWCKAVDYAGGDWIKFLFQDDLLEPMCLEKMLSATHDKVSLVVCGHNVLFGPEINEERRTRWQLYHEENSIRNRFAGRSFISSGEFAEHVARFPDLNCIGAPTATLMR
jgi:glycosyltransferase involved in cell wall biosynthesis